MNILKEAENEQVSIKETQQQDTQNHVNWAGEWEQAAIFAKDHWALIGFSSLSISAIAIHFYLVHEKIPLTITSQEIISGLPIVLSLITFYFLILAAAATLPATLVLQKGKETGLALLDVLSEPYMERENIPRQRIFLIFIWLTGVIAPSLIASYILYNFEIEIIGGYPGFFLIITALHSFLFSLITLLFPKEKRRQFLKEKWSTLAWCAASQVIIMINIAAIVELRTGGKSYYTALVISMSALALAQLIIAQVFRDITRNPKPVMRGCALAACVISFICLVPPLNHTLIGYVMESSATGGRNCVVFTWSPDAVTPLALHSLKDSGHSIDLKMPISAQGFYYVRPWPGDEKSSIHKINRTYVSELSSCNKKTNWK